MPKMQYVIDPRPFVVEHDEDFQEYSVLWRSFEEVLTYWRQQYIPKHGRVPWIQEQEYLIYKTTNQLYETYGPLDGAPDDKYALLAFLLGRKGDQMTQADLSLTRTLIQKEEELKTEEARLKQEWTDIKVLIERIVKNGYHKRRTCGGAYERYEALVALFPKRKVVTYELSR